SLSYTVSTNPSHGTVSIDPATGGYTYTPNANYNGSDSFEVTVADGKGGSTTVTVPVTVTAVNDAPVAQATTASGNEDTIIAVNLSGTDVDGTVASFKLSTLPSNGSFYSNSAGTGTALTTTDVIAATSNGATIYFKPNANWNGSTSFQYSATDNNGLISGSNATSTITVTAVNDAPVAQATTASGNEDTIIAVSLSGTDVDGTVASFKLSTLPSNGSFYSNSAGTGTALTTTDVIAATSNGATIYFKPNANWNGSTNFQYSATDNNGLISGSNATGTITVNPVNDAPVAQATTASGNEDTIIAVNLSGTDVDGTVASFKLSTLPANGSFYSNSAGTGTALTTTDVITATSNGATIYFKPNANWNGSTNFQYSATDNNGLISGSNATGTITVNPVNDAPVAQAATASGNEDTIIAVNLSGTDVDGTVASFKLSTLPSNGSFYSNSAGTGTALTTTDVIAATSNGATIYFKPNADWNGSTNFQYSATDNNGLISGSNATSTITVTAVNDAPVAQATTASGNEDTIIAVNLSGTDVDGTVASFKLSTLPSNGSFYSNSAGTGTALTT
ncbi:tandem-95 repeat protein, partial [Acinetobacter ursingii]